MCYSVVFTISCVTFIIYFLSWVLFSSIDSLNELITYRSVLPSPPEYVSLLHDDSTLFLRVHVHVRPSCLVVICDLLIPDILLPELKS